MTSLQNLGLAQIDPQLLDWMNSQIDAVERELAGLVSSPVSLVAGVGRHTLRAGGKRLRPAFTIVAAHAVGNPLEIKRTHLYGAVMEMIHMATLIHDDVIDESVTRRGQPTAHQVYGITQSVLSGDVLLAKAMAVMAQDGDVAVTRTVSEAAVEVAEGEVRELEARGNFDLTELEHLDILNLKTASFIRACCEVGGQLADASPEIRSALRAYGEHIGLAFQIADDILDYRGKGSETGKTSSIDFRDGQATLPLIRLKKHLSEEEERVLRSRFGNGVSDDEMRMICGWMETRGAFSEVEEFAIKEVELGKCALEPLPSSSYKDILVAVADYVLARRA